MPQSGPKIYSKEYYDTLLAIEGTHWWTLGMSDIMDTVLASRLKDQPELQILDMGCGSGVGLAWARSRLPVQRLLGIDVSAFAMQHCLARQELLQADLVLASAAATPLHDDSINAIICNDILQHVDDDQAVLNEAFRILKPGGLFFARTNGRFVLPMKPGCLRLYTKKQLRLTCQQVGFKILVLAPTNMFGALFAVIKHYLSAGKQHQQAEHEHHNSHNESGGLLIQAPKQHKKPSLSAAVLRKTLVIEGQLMQRFGGGIPFGHSHIVVAQKPPG